MEKMFGRLTDWRRLALRFERCAHTVFSAMYFAATGIFGLSFTRSDPSPLRANSGANDDQRIELKSRLAGVVIRSATFRIRIRIRIRICDGAASANDDPERLISALFNCMRDLSDCMDRL